MRADAVFEGAGIRGIAFVGAICTFEQRGYTWERIAGTSAGSIVAALLSAGYKGPEMKKILMDVDYTKFADKNKPKILSKLRMPYGLVKEKGIYSGDYIEQWMDELLKAKNVSKFKDISVNGVSKLKIIATDVTKRDMLILPDDLVKYNINPMEFKISRAVRMSIGMPLFFKPVELKYTNKVSYIIDGGIVSNFPVWIFDAGGLPRWPTFGFKLVEEKVSLTSCGKKDLVSFILDIIGTVTDKDEENYLKDKDRVRTISIPTLGIDTTDFKITKKDSMNLFEGGYKSAEMFLDSWNFQQYIKKYRK